MRTPPALRAGAAFFAEGAAAESHQDVVPTETPIGDWCACVVDSRAALLERIRRGAILQPPGEPGMAQKCLAGSIEEERR